MGYPTQKHDYFDRHRKDHTARPVLFTAALVGTALIWAALIASVLLVV